MVDATMFFDGGIGIWFVFVALIGLLFWGGIIVLIILGIRWLIRQNAQDRYQGTDATSDDTALALLRQRYAQGEIDAAEFEERKRILGG